MVVILDMVVPGHRTETEDVGSLEAGATNEAEVRLPDAVAADPPGEVTVKKGGQLSQSTSKNNYVWGGG